MEDFIIFSIIALLFLFAVVLPIGLWIWTVVLSGRIKRLSAEVASLKANLASGSIASPSRAPVAGAEPQKSPQPGSVAEAAPAPAPKQAGTLTWNDILTSDTEAVTTGELSAASAAAASVAAQRASVPAPALASEAKAQQPAQSVPQSEATAQPLSQAVPQAEPARQPIDYNASLQKAAAPAGSSTTAVQANKDNSGSDVTGYMLGNLFNKLGAVVVIIAAGIFVKLIAPYVFFNPWVKLLSGYLAGGVSLGIGLLLHKREKYGSYAEVLIGLGLAISFVMTYASCTVLELLSNTVAFGIACVLLIVVYGLAEYMKRSSLLVIGLIAGYTNLFIGSETEPLFVTVYMLLLSVMTLLTIYRGRMWLWVGNVNLAATLGYLVIYYECHRPKCGEAITSFAILSFWALYVLFDVLRYRRGISGSLNNLFSYLNFAFLSLFTALVMYSWEHTAFQIGLSMVAVSVGYGLLSAYYRHIDESISHAHLNMCLLALMVGIEACNQGLLAICLLVLIALVLTFWATLNKRKALLNWALAYFAAVFWPILLAPAGLTLYDLFHSDELVSVFQRLSRLYVLQLGLPAAGLMLASLVLRKRDPEEEISSYTLTFKLLGWTLLYLLFTVEIDPLFSRAVGSGFRRIINEGSTWCALAFLYVLQWYHTGCAKNRSWLRGLAYIVYAAALLMLGSLLTAYVVDSHSTSFVPLFNLRFGAVVMGLVTTAVLYRGSQQRLFVYIGLLLGFVGLHVEAAELAYLTVPYVVTTCWLAYAASTVLFGIYKPQNDCTYVGICLVLLTVWRLFVVDASDLDDLYKLLLFIAVGGALLALSFLYTKWYKGEKQSGELVSPVSDSNAPLVSDSNAALQKDNNAPLQ
ncbi:DUF2339 domain-containing protein [bacterium]|nr:DUF2339 domain-containing protein [bacterium]